MNTKIEGRFGKPRVGAAKVTLKLEDASSLKIKTDCTGGGWIGQGAIEEATQDGYNSWKNGAILGIKFALKKIGAEPIKVTIIKIEGMITDTNVTAVAAAAADGIWQFFKYEPDETLQEWMAQEVKEGWKNSRKLPDWL